MLRVGYYQFRPLFGKVQRNVKTVLGALSKVSADIIVLPELPFTGYYFKDRDEVMALSEDPERSSTVDSLVALCKQKDFHLVTGFAEKRKDKYFNSALLIGPDGIEHIYRKLHLFNEEKSWFDTGDIALDVQDVRGARVGLMVCFDWVFPEVARILSIKGADVVCHPANLVLACCQRTMLTRCLENSVFAVTANRFGVDRRPHGELRFTGKSQIVAPDGELLNRAPSQRQATCVMAIDLEEARDKAITPMNQLLEDRRPEFYRSIVDA